MPPCACWIRPPDEMTRIRAVSATPQHTQTSETTRLVISSAEYSLLNETIRTWRESERITSPKENR
jgi:hypothetical protein